MYLWNLSTEEKILVNNATAKFLLENPKVKKYKQGDAVIEALKQYVGDNRGNNTREKNSRRKGTR